MNHIMYCSCNIEHDGQNFLLFWTVFCSFILITTQKKKFLKNWKNFTHVSHKRQSHDVWFLSYQCNRQIFFVILDHFFPFTPLTTQKKFEEIKKNNSIYYHSTQVYHKRQSYVCFLRYGARQTNFFCYFGQLFALLSL